MTQSSTAEGVAAILAEHAHRPGPLLPVLHGVQDALGHIPAEAVPLIAEALRITRAEVHGVISFYHDFRTAPAGRRTLQICQAEACQARGCRSLVAHAKATLGVDDHQTTADGAITLEPVYCLGNCANGPSIRLDDRVHGAVTPDRLDALIGAPAEAGPDPLALDAPAPPAGEAPCRVYVPRDTTANSLGADAVADALIREAETRGRPLELVRNGSRGLFWLEPLIEVETAAGRLAYGPVTSEVVPALVDAGLLEGRAEHPLCLGPVEELPWLREQQRLTFARAGVIDPLSVADYHRHGGFRGLEMALDLSPAQMVAAVRDSGLRGRGGAAFPAGIKWQTVLEADARRPHGRYKGRKFVVCNADEGDSGTFADRLLMEADPLLLIEGMVIAGLATGADTGFIYLRSEYPLTQRILDAAIAAAEAAGYLGDNILGSGRSFHLEVRLGAGAYICGEETALLDSLEGKRGQVRVKPPLPAIEGLFGQPTLVHNVLTLAAVPTILAEGGDAYAEYGRDRSTGTQAFQLAGNLRRGGLVELPFGVTLRELLDDWGGGSASGRPLRAVQVGGPLGAYLPEALWDTPLDYEAFAEVGAMVGHGGIVAFDDSVDMAEQARFAMEFCAVESCGKCTPCRLGSTRGVEVIDRITGGRDPANNLELLDDLCQTMEEGSLCAMGGLTPAPVRSALSHFPHDFDRRIPAKEA